MNQAVIPAIPRDCLANGTISLILPNLSALYDAEGKVKQIISAVHEIGGMKWRMELKDANVPNNLNLFVHCDADVKDRLWMCEAELLVPLDSSASAFASYYYYFGFHSRSCFFEEIFIQESITEELGKGPVEIKMDVQIYNVLKKSLPPLDTSLVVNMDEGRSEILPVNKHLLAGQSSFFRNLFFEDWNNKKEQANNTFELNESGDVEHMLVFKFMIYGAMTIGWLANESYIFKYGLCIELIKLAVKYDFAMMVDFCEKILVEKRSLTYDKNYSKMELLELAEEFNLDLLKEHCLNELGVLDFMENFGKNIEIHLRLSEATQERLREKFDGKAKEMRDTAMELKTKMADHIIEGYTFNRVFVQPFNKLLKAMLGERASK